MDHPWLAAETAGLINGVAGGTLIALCALFGGFSRWLAERDRGRGLVGSGFVFLAAIGLSALVLGAVAVICGQPRYVWCPTAVIGVAVIATLGLGLPGIVQRYRRAREKRELRDLAQKLMAGRSSRVLAKVNSTHGLHQ
ncbi:MAG: hypothetical protein H0W83_12710 [Planctomycetes bacterium]|nr:hypothetical protein [Planctomycetota bacterium]